MVMGRRFETSSRRPSFCFSRTNLVGASVMLAVGVFVGVDKGGGYSSASAI